MHTSCAGIAGAALSEDRPRERLFRVGVDHLASTELLAVLLGAGIPGAPAHSVAKKLIERAGSLVALSRAWPGELVGVAGVGQARAARVVAAFEVGRRALGRDRRQPIAGAEDIYRLLRPRLSGLNVEVGLVIGLTAKNEILTVLEVARGDATSIPVHPREVFGPLVRHGAVGGVFVHNHPSGDPTPSPEDIALTHRLVEGGELLGIPLIDHVIVASAGYTSLASFLGTSYRQ